MIMSIVGEEMQIMRTKLINTNGMQMQNPTNNEIIKDRDYVSTDRGNLP